MTPRIAESRGQTLVEFALILPVFILVLVGILDLGRGVFAYNTLNNAAREGARLAIVDQTEANIQAEAAESAVSLGVTAADVSVDYRNPLQPNTPDSCAGAPGTDATVGCMAVVRVVYDYDAATPILSQIIGTISMAGESRFRVESACLEPTDPSCPIGD